MLVDRKRRLVEIRCKRRNALTAKFGADIPVSQQKIAAEYTRPAGSSKTGAIKPGNDAIELRTPGSPPGEDLYWGYRFQEPRQAYLGCAMSLENTQLYRHRTVLGRHGRLDAFPHG